MTEEALTEFAHRLQPGEEFAFACHPGVGCFTECCRMLELSLTPYDVLRLRQGTGKTAAQLFDQCIIVEHLPGEPFPRFYLTMVDDGRASCFFVGAEGCQIYPHRPAACRSYPLGRAVMVRESELEEFFVLLKEDHCQGFQEKKCHDAASYSADQELARYNLFNDRMARILQHGAIRKGYLPTASQLEDFTLALYDLDRFRERLTADRLDGITLSASGKKELIDDEKLLEFAMDWVEERLFSDLKGIFRAAKTCATTSCS